ncbi:SAM-dependent methyltransferase [Amylocarpus encephaloides]|uniref:SAM-dependent methyltransferase n=1 Tax=Amylocarpus encephaloides TaxID=45428 RepID=A0A9P8C1W3_9HELO|nr:SAM-dependent methyltransferase [Amylocarpus encephaloides]
MDVGVGTGYFPAATLKRRRGTSSSDLESNGVFEHLTLVDLNANSLSSASRRIGEPKRTRCLVADAFNPLPLPLVDGKPEQFESISLFYLLHCLQGPPSSKGKIFAHLKHHLVDGGVLFGATVLGKGDFRHNLFSNGLMWFYNSIGLFDNWEDTEDCFVEALTAEFHEVESKVIGCSLLFKASKPRR